MDDLQQQKNQIDETARKTKEEAETTAFEARRVLADQEADGVRRDAEDKATQIQNDAQK